MYTPGISIVIPCFNEEKNIAALLDSIRMQTVELESLEVIIADGLSTDNTRKIIQQYSKDHPELRIHTIDNEKRVIPAGLNKAIRAAEGEIILRMDAHSLPAMDYVARSVAALKEGLGDNVGGVIDIRPSEETWIAQAIAVATAHPLGVGDAKYRRGTKASEADTVAFGCFYKSTIEKVGYFNESLLVNEDYEFNARLRNLGLKVWVDPAIKATYFSRPSLQTLAKQYYTYGFWKLIMLREFPKTLRWRQALPPAFILGILMLLLLTIFWFPAIWILIAVLLSYLLILAAGAVKPMINLKMASLLFGLPMAIITMHFSWGAGFWVSLFSHGKKEN